MAPSRRSKVTRAAKLVDVLQDLVGTLPNKEEMRKLTETLDVLIRFLEDIRQQLKTAPTSEDTKELSATLDRLGEFFERAESNPILARAIGLEKPRPRARPPSSEPPDSTHGTELLARLDNLTLDQIRERLTLEDAYGLADLRALAAALHLRVQQRTGRETLANQIVTALANRRGYRELSGDSQS